MKISIEQQIKEYHDNDFSNFSSNLLMRIKVTHIALVLMLLINIIFFTTEFISIVIQLCMVVAVIIHDYDDKNLKKELTKNSIQTIELTEVASKDYLTQIPNRRCFFEMGEKTFHSSHVNKTDFTVLFLDIDFFKKVNDELGHDVGDEILKLIANVLKKSIRTSDLLARMGGEEFAIILPKTGINAGLLISENIRQIVEKTTYSYKNNDISVTISIGLAQRTLPDITLSDVLKRADYALYKAKKSGRNKCVAESELLIIANDDI